MTKSLKNIYLHNKNKWVAIDQNTNELIAVGGTITEVNKKLPKDNKNIELTYVSLSSSIHNQ